MRIGFLGGTGAEARGLAVRFAAAGLEIILGSRDPGRAAIAAGECNGILGRPHIHAMENARMIESSEIVFLTVPFGEAVQAIRSYRESLTGRRIIVDVTVPMIFGKSGAEYLVQADGSGSESIARHVPEGVPVVAAFKTLPASVLANLATDLDCDVLVCSDDEQALQKVIAVASLIPSLRPIHAGALRAAGTLERMAVLAVQLNRRHKKTGARFRIVGM